MPETATATALSRFAYRGQAYQAGDALVMGVMDALTYAQRGLVSLSKRRTTIGSRSETSTQKKRRQTYQRRDLVATRK